MLDKITSWNANWPWSIRLLYNHLMLQGIITGIPRVLIINNKSSNTVQFSLFNLPYSFDHENFLFLEILTFKLGPP